MAGKLCPLCGNELEPDRVMAGALGFSDQDHD
jgi:hypothetical protein